MTLDNKMPKPKLIHVQHEVGYEKDGALDYFHTCTDSKYEDEKKYKVVIRDIISTIVTILTLYLFVFGPEVFQSLGF